MLKIIEYEVWIELPNQIPITNSRSHIRTAQQVIITIFLFNNVEDKCSLGGDGSKDSSFDESHSKVGKLTLLLVIIFYPTVKKETPCGFVFSNDKNCHLSLGGWFFARLQMLNLKGEGGLSF